MPKSAPPQRQRLRSLIAPVALALSFLTIGQPLSADTYYWDPNGTTAPNLNPATGTWGTGFNSWNMDSAGGTATVTDNPAVTDDLVFAVTGSSSAYAVTVAGSQNANSITFLGAGFGAPSLSGGTINLGAGGITANTGHAAVSFGSALVIASAEQFTNSGNTALVFTGGLTGTGDLTLKANGTTTAGTVSMTTTDVNMTGSITNSGSGPGGVTISSNIGGNVTGIIQNSTTSGLTLSGTNTSFAGGVTVQAGSVTATTASAFGTGTLVVGHTSGSNNASVTLGAVGGNVTNAITIQGGNNGVASLSAGSTGNRSFTGTITLVGGHGVTLSGGSLGGFSGKITQSGGTSGVVTINPSGNLTYFGNSGSDYGGGTVINTGGSMSFTAGGSVFGTGNLTINGLSVNQQGSSVTLTGTNTQTWNGDWGTSGGGAGSFTLNLSGNIDLGSQNTGGSTGNTNRTLTISQNTTTIAGIMQNGSNGLTTGLTKAGGNTLVLSAQSTYTGSTIVNAGTLRIAIADALPTGTDLIVNTGAYFDLNGQNQTVKSLSGSSGAAALVANSGTTANDRTLTITSTSGTQIYEGNLSNSASTLGIVKSGGSTLILNGVVSTTGANSISAGTLIANGDGVASSGLTGQTWSNSSTTITLTAGGGTGLVRGQRLSGTGIGTGTYITSISGDVITLSRTTTGAATGTGNITFAANGALGTGATTVSGTGTLGGTGTFKGVTTIQSGGTLAPGASAGLMAFESNLTLQTNSAFNFELTDDTTAGRGTNYDAVDVTGSAVLTLQTGVTANIIFNTAGSAVDFADTFWDSDHSWVVFDTNIAPTIDLPGGIFSTVNASVDSLGNSFASTGGQLSFSQDANNDVILKYTAVPEGHTGTLLLAGLAAGAIFRRRRFGFRL